MVKTNLQGKKGVFDWINLVFLTVVCLTMLYPFYNLLMISISTIDDVMKNSGMMLLPKHINLEGYQYVLRYGGLGDAYKVTIFITVVGTGINLIMTSLGACVLSRKDMPGRNMLMTIVLITMFFSGGLIPTYIVVAKIHLVGSVWALILPGAINTFNMILARNFFEKIPLSLTESAMIDGASELTILIRIIVPLSTPILATLALFYGVAHWNTYSAAIIYINNPKLYPLQVLIRSMYNVAINELDGDSLPPPVETVRCATVMLATLPIICVYPFLQKYFVQGIMVGSLKG